MSSFALALFTLLAIAAGSLSLSLWASRRTHNAADFAISSRRLGAWLTALGFTMNVVSGWMLLLLCAAAFLSGFTAVWVWAGFVLGAAIATFYIAPRLRAASAGQGAFTILQVLGAEAGDRLQPVVVRSALAIIVMLLAIQVGAALHLAATMLAASFDFARSISLSLGVAVVALGVFAGGVHSAAAHEAAQASLYAVIALFLPIGALLALGGWEQIEIALGAVDAVWRDPFTGKESIVAFALAAGGVGLGLAICGQPHALNRFMAARDDLALSRARWLALAAIAVLAALAIGGGWAANLLYGGLERPEFALVEIANRMAPPALAAMFVAALSSVVLTSIIGPLLTLSVSLVVDLRRGIASASFGWMKAAAVFLAMAALAVGLYTSDEWLDHVLFSFTTLGAVLGPLVLVRASGKRIRPGSMLGAIWSGFALSVIFHLLPDSPGDFLERVLPFVAALGVALSGGERRRNPDRADRAQETVHDRVPI